LLRLLLLAAAPAAGCCGRACCHHGGRDSGPSSARIPAEGLSASAKADGNRSRPRVWDSRSAGSPRQGRPLSDLRGFLSGRELRRGSRGGAPSPPALRFCTRRHALIPLPPLLLHAGGKACSRGRDESCPPPFNCTLFRPPRCSALRCCSCLRQPDPFPTPPFSLSPSPLLRLSLPTARDNMCKNRAPGCATRCARCCDGHRRPTR